MSKKLSPKQKPQKLGQCVYCGVTGPITDDHVPPRSFYPKQAPLNLLTVPCCYSCNEAFGKNDDYVRLVFTTTEGAMNNASRNALIPAVKRFAERKESKNVLKSLYETLETGYLPTAEGILVQGQYSVIDGAPLTAFAQRVVKATFYREKGHRLPDGYEVNTIHHRQMHQALQIAGSDADFYDFILGELTQTNKRKSWGDVFGYSWVQLPNDPEATWWLLDFYEIPMFLCSTWNPANAFKGVRGDGLGP